MRTSLFLSTLFAVSMLGGAALAEKPQMVGTTREPRVVEHLRAHGDIVDKSYSAPERPAMGAPAARDAGASTTAPTQRGRAPLDRSASRVNCSDSGVDCLAVRGSSPRVVTPAAGSSAPVTRAPAFLDKILGSDRTDFNEAGLDQGMSERAVKRAWSHTATDAHGAGASVPLAQQRQVERTSQQASSARMSCNEADECSMSAKDARKEWASASIKAGTWSGPAKEPVSNAALRIAAQRAAEGTHGSQTERGHAKGESSAHEADQH